ncbi:MAG TPA: hypothetical protein VI299_05580 [Polyangiales bacterium]
MSVKRVYRSAARFIVLIALAAWPSQFVRAHVSSALCILINPWLAELSFGQGGHAELHAAQVSEVRRAGEAVSADAELRLQLTMLPQPLHVGVNLRREFFLPLATFAAAVIASPSSWRTRSLALLLGLPFAFYVCFSGLFVTTCWLFAHYAPAVFPLSPTESKLLEAIVSMALMPPTPRLLVPLLIAAALLLALGPEQRVRPRR